MKRKTVILTPAVMKRISTYIGNGYLKNEIATKIGICRQTLHRWETKNPKLKELFKEQTLIRTEILKDEILEIADDKSGDLLKDPDTGREYPNAANVSRSTLQIKAREKIMKYDNPERFAGNTNVDVVTEGSGLQVVINYGKPDEDEE